METSFTITRNQIKSYLSNEWKVRNYCQARYISAANDGRAKDAEVFKNQAIYCEHRAMTVADFLGVTNNIYCVPDFDFKTPRVPEGYHPVTTIRISWHTHDTETVEISG